MISHTIGSVALKILGMVVSTLTFLKIKPNHLTTLGVVMCVVTGFAFAKGDFYSAGWLLIVAGLFDMVDGMVARIAEAETPFGAFYDSIMDRYSDLILYLGIMIYYGTNDRMAYVVLVGVCMMGSVLTSYARARAECFIPKCKVGFLERPERIVLLLIGAFSYHMDQVLWVLAVLSNWTVIHRMIYTRSVLNSQVTKSTDPKSHQILKQENSPTSR